MHPPHTPGVDQTPSLPAPTVRRSVWPGRDERLVFLNILLLLALPLLGYAAHLYRAAGTYELSLPVRSDHAVTMRFFLNLGAGLRTGRPAVRAGTRRDRWPRVPRARDRARRDGSGPGSAFRPRAGSDDPPGPGVGPHPGRRNHRRRAPARSARAGRYPAPRPPENDDGARVEIGPKPNDPTAQLDFPQTLLLPFDHGVFLPGVALGILLYIAASFGALLGWRRLLHADRFRARVARGQVCARSAAILGRAGRSAPIRSRRSGWRRRRAWR